MTPKLLAVLVSDVFIVRANKHVSKKHHSGCFLTQIVTYFHDFLAFCDMAKTTFCLILVSKVLTNDNIICSFIFFVAKSTEIDDGPRISITTGIASAINDYMV